MKNYKVFLSLLVFIGIAACRQSSSIQDFDRFRSRQDSLFMVAYEKRDIAEYLRLLSAYLSRYEKLSESDQKSFAYSLSNAYYNLTCAYSLNGDKVNALVTLKLAINAGYFDYTHLMEDKDLENIRQVAEFRKLAEPLRQIGDFRYILKKAEKYNPADSRSLPSFSYQASTHPDLVALKTTFRLDSIAGSGDELSKIKNLLHWIHTLVPHDGNHGNPAVMNAMNMIAVCKRDHRGLNCRGLATVLNECYLSLGFKSRFVTCLPKDSLKRDNDCHVINMVYAATLKKWIWMDPTNEAYVSDEKGNLLGPEEVRERIINDLPLILNPDANWNGRNSVTASDYLYRYMAKNLYILECPVNSCYNAETGEPGKLVSYIRLLPLDYFIQNPDKTTGNGAEVYKTNNPVKFWQAP